MKLIYTFLLSFSFLIASTNSDQKRVALIIGNNSYQTPNQLNNPLNDAHLMKKTLQNSGFDVILLENGTRDQMREKIEKFKFTQTNGGVKLFYFAGHGMEVDGKNYLLPIDSSFDDKKEIPYQAIALNDILHDMKHERDMLDIVILDACRNNPLSSINSKGLAPLGDTYDTFVGYATQAGNTAQDGVGENGVYTKSLAKYINEVDLSIEEVFKKTYNEVYQETNGAQKPITYSQIATNFYFNSKKRALKVKKSNQKNDIVSLPARVHIRYIEPQMVKIPKGSFIMGDLSSYQTKSLHKVLIKDDFYIGQYEVTFKEYDMFCKDAGYQMPNDFGWKRANQPVVDISYNDAIAYTTWLSKKTKKNYTLPTEAQWEYVARGTSKTKYFFENEAHLDNYVWYEDTAFSHPFEVGLKKPNKFGVYDILGNVREWVKDDYLPYKNVEQDGAVYSDNTNKKVIRGGSYQSAYDEVTVYQRDFDIKSFKDKQTGFRVVLIP